MSESTNKFEVNLPVLEWQGSGWWLTACGTIAAVATIIIPSMTEWSWTIRLFVALITLFIAPAIIFILIYGLKVGFTFVRRSILYADLFKHYLTASSKLDAAQKTILALKSVSQKLIIIQKIQYYKGVIYIIIEKTELELEIGDLIAVIDTQDGMPLGQFQVSNVRQNEYVAMENGYMDPLWRGYIYQTGESQIHTPPDAVAFLVKEELNNNV